MIKKTIICNLILINAAILIIIIFLELLTRTYINNGMNYNLEMMKYSKSLKIKSKNFSVENNDKFIDSITVLREYEENSLWVTKEDSHANDKAQRIIG